MVYLIGWGGIFYLLFVQEISRYYGKAFLVFGLFLFCMLAFFRGNVGTDTGSYEIMFADFALDYVWDGREPLFVGLGQLLSSFAPTVELAVRATALVFFGLLGWFVAFSDRNERFLLMSYILPAFAYQYSMNALRLGIASAFLLIAVQLLRRKGQVPAILAGLVAVFFHYSIFFSVLYISVSQRPWFRFSAILSIIIMLAAAVGGLSLIDVYMGNKLDGYKDMHAQGALSGLSKIIPLFFIIVGVIWSNLPGEEKAKLVILSVVLIFAGWVLTQFSYAGLRVLDLLSFSVPIAILASYSRLQLAFDKSIKVALAIGGLSSALGIWRGFMLDYGQGSYPFMPYNLYGFDLL